MNNRKLRKQKAEKRFLERASAAVKALKGKMLKVIWLPEDSQEIGYTMKGSTRRPEVYIMYDGDNFVFHGITEEEKGLCRRGIFVHEMLHQCLTNFDYTNRKVEERREKSEAEAGILMEFFNTLEDPAIEYQAPAVCGGWMLDSLHYMIKHVYEVSPAIGTRKEETPYSQLMNALIHFGDMGIVKGHFTFPEAKECFEKIAPIYNDGIECTDAKKRFDYAEQCMEIARPLWEEQAKQEDFMRELMKKLGEALKRSGKGTMSGSSGEGDGTSGTGKGITPSKASERRRLTTEEIKKGKAGAEGSGKEEKDGSEGSKGSGTGSEGSGSESEEKGSGAGSSSTPEGLDLAEDEDGDGMDMLDLETGEDLGNGGGGRDSEGSGEPEGSEEKPSGDAGEGDSPSGHAGGYGYDKDSGEADEMAEDTYVIDEAKAEEIEKRIEEEEAKIEKEEKEEATKKAPLPDFDISKKNSSASFSDISCLNRRVSSDGSLSEAYAKLRAKFIGEARGLAKSLNRIFLAEAEEDVKSTSGRYSIIRGESGTTAKIFDRRKVPDDMHDAAVMLLIDMSGSMYSAHKDEMARKAAIVLSEALMQAKIPYYVMGFTADTQGYDAVHYHFVDWADRKSDMETLAAISAHANNFDGYSIRYAAKLLEKRNAENKMLFIVSDGLPACCSYESWDSGYSDTVNAVKDARKVAKVFGIALGKDCGAEELLAMYGKDFIHVEDPAMLSTTLSKQLVKSFKPE